MLLLRDEECDGTIAFLDFLPTIESAETVKSSVFVERSLLQYKTNPFESLVKRPNPLALKTPFKSELKYLRSTE
uniref:Uncharacterized protein n=1 Tax=Schistosoma haematobium TaxID=6185 RepID=A0A095ANG3_SCHHA